VPVGTVDYGALYNERPAILKRAADRLLAEPSKAYTDFCAAQDFWLDDYALFMALKAEQGQAGLADWPDALRTREPSALAAAKERLAAEVDYYKAVQFFFYTQWNALKTYANRASSWWATSPSTSARIPATSGPGRSFSRPMGRST
jgi:4-alpha-glucanotransferase